MSNRVEQQAEMNREWLKEHGYALEVTADDCVPLWVAAAMLKVSESTVRRKHDEDGHFKFLPCGRGKLRNRWQITLISIAVYQVGRTLQGGSD